MIFKNGAIEKEAFYAVRTDSDVENIRYILGRTRKSQSMPIMKRVPAKTPDTNGY
jgi:hypothetical protein